MRLVWQERRKIIKHRLDRLLKIKFRKQSQTKVEELQKRRSLDCGNNGPQAFPQQRSTLIATMQAFMGENKLIRTMVALILLTRVWRQIRIRILVLASRRTLLRRDSRADAR